MKNTIINIGLNHETAPVEVRECLAGKSDTPLMALAALRSMADLQECFFLSTCNRVEVVCTSDRPPEAEVAIRRWMAAWGGIPEESLQAFSFCHRNRGAVEHVFRVASSLDSMVVGEPQILGQIKEAYALAAKEHTTGVVLNRLLHKAFHAAKRIRSETGIADAAVSIAYAAVELARKIFNELSGRGVLLIGAGDMAELTAKHLLAQGVQSLTVANRTFEKAVQVADQCQGRAVGMQELSLRLLEDDMVIVSTAATGYIVTREQVKGSMRRRRNRPLFFIDIAVPRNVEPAVNEIENVYLYDIDDLKGVVAVNQNQRRLEALKAERIIQEEAIRFERWLEMLEVVPTIIDLKTKAEVIRQGEIKRSLPALGPIAPEQMKAVESLTLSIIEKILNHPILVLKGKAERPSKDMYLHAARTLFNLDREKDGEDEDES